MKTLRNWVLFFALSISGYILVSNNDLHWGVRSLGFLLYAVTLNIELTPQKKGDKQ